jgi:hypothetical protein
MDNHGLERFMGLVEICDAHPGQFGRSRRSLFVATIEGEMNK